MVAMQPSPALSRTYLLFFDLDSAELSPRSQTVIIEIADELRAAQNTQGRSEPSLPLVPARAMFVEVIGHADAAEAAAGKASVGRTRAEAVAALLRLNGVPGDRITVSFFGADRPLVPNPGADPQNRRVEFVYR